MGDFRFVLEAAGPHGCDRDAKDGDRVYGCGHQACPDCMCRKFINYLKYTRGLLVSRAELTHWPSDMKDREYKKENEVKDDLLTHVRSGSF